MKKAKLLSLFLAGSLLFQTAGIDAMATMPSEPVPISETIEDTDNDLSDQPSEDEGEGEDIDVEDTNPDQPSEGEGDVEEENPDVEDTDPDQSSEGEGNTEDTDAEDTDPDQPSEGDGDTEDTDAEDTDPDQPSEDVDVEEEETEDPDAEEDSEDSVSENTVSENTISENTLAEDETNVFSIFPGLGDSYTLSSQQLADKRVLASHMGDVVKLPATAVATIADFKDASDKYKSGEVVYLAETEEEAEQVAAAFGGTLDSYSYEVAVISLPEEATVALAIAAAADPEIKLPAVWPNYYQYLHEDTNSSIESLKPSDPDFDKQWMHDYIGTRYAWAAGYKGQGVKVAVIDTGLAMNHEDLSTNAIAGKNFVDGAEGTSQTTDNDEHGTHVAGIIAADDNGKGVVGIAPDAQVCGFCVFPTGGGADSGDVMRAINAAVAEDYDIINMSLGSSFYDANYEKTVNNAYTEGVAIFASSGNDDSDGNNYPAAYAGTISVGAVDENSARASFSNYGKTVTLSFPGVHIYSTIPGSASSYGYMSGTSQASPAAAGTAAVILSAKKDAKDFKDLTGKKRVDKLLSLMKSSTTKCSSAGMGAGTTYLPGVLKLATDMTAPETPVITVVDEENIQRGTNKKDYIAESLKVKLSSATAVGVDIYYSTDGKAPAYKNGVITNADSATPYKIGDEIVLTGAKSKTIKAIAVNPISGKVSKVATKTVTLTPIPKSVTVTPTGNVTKIAAGKSLKFTAAVELPYAISNKVAWTVTDENDKDVKASGVTVSNGTVKTTSSKTVKTPAGKYKVTATAVGGTDLKVFNGQSGSYVFEVIESSSVKKVAFMDADKKAPKAKSIKTTDSKTTDTNEALDLSAYLTVTKAGASAKEEVVLKGSDALAEVVWSSSNTRIATVDSKGVITAVAPGKATIKATSNDGLNKSASYNVTVVQPVTGITISGPNEVAAGKGIALTAAITPANANNKKVNWEISGDGKNVSINKTSGKITTKKETAPGEYTVTAKAADGLDPDAAATYKITVINEEITEIKLDKTKLTMFPPNTSATQNTTETLTPTIKGKAVGSTAKPAPISTTRIIWASSAPAIASVDQSGKITAIAPGKANITCTAADGSGKKATCAVTVTVPMSKLVIGSTNGNSDGNAASTNIPEGCVAVGKSLKLAAKYYSNYGTPNNKKIKWEIVSYGNAALEGKVKIDKNGTVSVDKTLALPTSNAYVTVQATAEDGSGVKSNIYRINIRKLFLTARIELTDDGGYMIYATTIKTTPKQSSWNTARWEAVPDYCTATISGSKGCGLKKSRFKAVGDDSTVYADYLPIPTKRTTHPAFGSYLVPMSVIKKECESMKLTIQLKDGSNLKVTESLYAVFYVDAQKKEHLIYF